MKDYVIFNCVTMGFPALLMIKFMDSIFINVVFNALLYNPNNIAIKIYIFNNEQYEYYSMFCHHILKLVFYHFPMKAFWLTKRNEGDFIHFRIQQILVLLAFWKI